MCTGNWRKTEIGFDETDLIFIFCKDKQADMKKVNVLFIFHFTEMGGAERLIFDITKKMNRTRYQPLVCCLLPFYKARRYKGKYTKAQILDMGNIASEILAKNNTPMFKIDMQTMLSVSAIVDIYRLIKKKAVDIVFCLDTQPERTTGLIASVFSPGIKLILSSHYDPYDLKQNRYLTLLDKLLLRFVDKVTATSAYHKKKLVDSEKIAADKISIMHNGSDLNRFKCVTSSLSKQGFDLSLGDEIVGIVARLVPMKGHSVLLDAARLIIEKRPNTHFLIVGDGQERDSLELQSKKLNIQTHVHFLGTRTDIPELLPLFDVAVLCSQSEIFGISLLEYMISEKAIVATKVGGIPEVIVDGETGLLVEPGNPATLADGIVKLLTDTPYAKKLGKAAKERAVNVFSIEAMVNKIEVLFDEVSLKHDSSSAAISHE